MRPIMQATLFAVLCCTAASAKDETQQGETQQAATETGRGVVCETVQQAERFAMLRGDGKESDIALRTVNQEAHNSACNIARVRFSGAKPVEEFTVRGKLISVMAITVHSYSSGFAWRDVPASVRYTVVAYKGTVI